MLLIYVLYNLNIILKFWEIVKNKIITIDIYYFQILIEIFHYIECYLYLYKKNVKISIELKISMLIDMIILFRNI